MCCVKEDFEQLTAIMFRVISFYEGGISLEVANSLPLPQLFEAEYHASKIAEENRKAAKKTN